MQTGNEACIAISVLKDIGGNGFFPCGKKIAHHTTANVTGSSLMIFGALKVSRWAGVAQLV